MKLDALMEAAAREREIRAERTINYLRIAASLGAGGLDIATFAATGRLGATEAIWGGLTVAVFGTYLWGVHHWTRGDRYRPWLKYVTVGVDYGLSAAIFGALIHMGLPNDIGMGALVGIFSAWLVLINLLSAFRSGHAVIAHSTGLGLLTAFGIGLASGAPALVVVYPMGLVAASGAVVWAIASSSNRQFLSLRRKEQLLRFLSKELVESFEAGELDLGLGGTKRRVTILLSDIRGFTSLSESRDPLEVIGLLNDYFKAMSRVVFENGGVIDKFIGDAILAVFGAPIEHGDEAFRAVQTAIGMRRALDELNQRLAGQGRDPIRIGVALHSGEVVAGNIGSEQRMEYTVIGDTVNVTSRIEGLNKKYQTWLLMSEELVAELGDRVAVREVGQTQVKGRQQPVRLFSLDEESP